MNVDILLIETLTFLTSIISFFGFLFPKDVNSWVDMTKSLVFIYIVFVFLLLLSIALQHVIL